MSLAVAALRIATVKALDVATSAGDRVYDSVVDPVDLLGEKAEPTIIVYADAGTIDIKDRALFEGTQIVDLTIEMFIGRAIAIETGENEGQIELQIPATDASYDNYLRCLVYEVNRALLRRDDQSPWPDIWASLIARGAQDNHSQWDRGANADHGRRFAFLRLVYRFEVMADPLPGQPVNDLWSRILNAMDADDELKQISAFWRTLITSPAIPDWRQAQEQLGLTNEAIGALGPAPLAGDETDAAPAAIEIDVVTGAGATIAAGADGATIAEDSGAPVPIAEG
jgi:hypothetical protein